MLTAFGVGSASLMVAAYALERRSQVWIIVFALACLSTAAYGALTGAWIFAVLETVWSAIAVHRYRQARADSSIDAGLEIS